MPPELAFSKSELEFNDRFTTVYLNNILYIQWGYHSTNMKTMKTGISSVIWVHYISIICTQATPRILVFCNYKLSVLFTIKFV